MQTIGIALREALGADVDREWLREQLLAERGIRRVSFEPGETHRLTIEYDPQTLSESELLDCIYRHGVYPEPEPASTP